MKTPEEFKKNLIACMDEAIEVAENGDAHDLLDFADRAHARMSETLTYIQQIEAEKGKPGKKLLCQITVDGEDVLRKALDKTEVDGKTLAEWIELAKGYKHLEQELAATKRERDAAVADMKQAQGCICTICKNHYRPDPAVRRYECKTLGKLSEVFGNDYTGALVCGKFEWRGVCPDTEVQDGNNATKG